MDRIKISVLEEDIKQGKRRSRTSCPIGLAIKRKLESAKYINPFTEETYTVKSSVTVNPMDFSICLDTENFYFNLPPNAISFIVDFDTNRNDVKPFEFEALKTN